MSLLTTPGPTAVGSGICRFGFGYVIAGPADAGDRGLEAQAADRGFHLAVIALITDKFGAYLDVAVGAGVVAGDGPHPEFGAGQRLHQQGPHVGFLFIAGVRPTGVDYPSGRS